VLRFLNKLKVQLLYDPVVPFSSIYQRECKSAHKSVFIAALFTIAKVFIFRFLNIEIFSKEIILKIILQINTSKENKYI
jgi:hypothetical protein